MIVWKIHRARYVTGSTRIIKANVTIPHMCNSGHIIFSHTSVAIQVKRDMKNYENTLAICTMKFLRCQWPQSESVTWPDATVNSTEVVMGPSNNLAFDLTSQSFIKNEALSSLSLLWTFSDKIVVQVCTILETCVKWTTTWSGKTSCLKALCFCFNFSEFRCDRWNWLFNGISFVLWNQMTFFMFTMLFFVVATKRYSPLTTNRTSKCGTFKLSRHR